jgi:hypothetical protein
VDAIETEIQKSAERLLTALRKGRGIDSVAAESLKQSLRQAAAEWRSSRTVSKSAANLFIDLASGISALAHSYGNDEGRRIEALADELGELVRQCVAVDEGV